VRKCSIFGVLAILQILVSLMSYQVLAGDDLTGEKYMVTLNTSLGSIELALDAENAPNTVANFVKYVEGRNYDGTLFHRVIPNFMIQGGGMRTGLIEIPTLAPIENEATNGLKNLRGTIAMARTQDPHSATAQFFINLKDNSFLDHTEKSTAGWGYTVFGQVSSGMDIVDKIAEVETGSVGHHENVPLEDVVIDQALLSENQ
jgi:peptidyl-prolyl cis-trans isomerase B (cyclophilin B)